ncbi:MAG: hypothetical protein ACK4Q5_04640 [Saprospiraceae bacterium]
MKHFSIFVLACLFAFLQTNAQPTEIFLGGAGKDLLVGIVPTADGNFLATGAKQVGDHTHVWLLKIAPAGDVLWEKTIAPTTADSDGYGHGLTVLADGSIVVAGEQRTDDPFDPGTALAIKTDAAGGVIWKRSYANLQALYDAAPSGSGLLCVGLGESLGSSESGLLMLINANGILQWKLSVDVFNQTKVRRIFPTANGKYLLLGRSNVIGAGFGGVFLRKIEPDGSQIWQKTHDTDWDELHNGVSGGDFYNRPLGAVQDGDGSVWITNPRGYVSDIALLRFSEAGELLADKNYGSPTFYEYPYSLARLPDGGWLVAGEAFAPGESPQGFAARIDQNGLEIWRRYYGAGDAGDQLFGGGVAPGGQMLLAGASYAGSGPDNPDGWLLRPDPDGNVLPWRVEGRVVFDLNNNCQADAGEPPAAGWFVAATDTATRWIVTDPNGAFAFPTGDGDLTLAPRAPDSSWVLCTPSQQVSAGAANPVAGATFLVQAKDGDCPRTEVSLTQPDLVRCRRSKFFVTVQNKGLGESGDLLLNLSLDPALRAVSASEPFTALGHTLEFAVPPMGRLSQKTIAVEAELACDVQIGATHTAAARLLPLECAPAWSGPRFAVEGSCTGDEARFSLKNDGGGGPTASTRYRVLADDLLASDWSDVALPEGAPAHELVFPADGRTWRVELEQAPGFPLESRPAAVLEACGKGSSGLHSIAAANIWPFDEGAPDVAAVLMPNTTGVPNKVAEARHGLGTYNLIDDTGWLEFTARARNPLTENVEEVEFRLRFSPTLDVSSFQVAAGNAPVQLGFQDAETLRATMSGLQLGAGESAMLRFRVRPLAGTPPDSGQASLFRVAADAYFDGMGPNSLAVGYLNFSQTFPLATDEYNTYPPEILRLGGRNFDFGTAMAAAPDGSVFLVGESNSFSERTNYDGFLVKTDPTGRAFWLTALDLGDGGGNTFRGAAAMPDGGCMAVGNYRSPDATTSNFSEYHAYAARVDASGLLLWHKKFRPAGAQYGAWTDGIIGTDDGGFILFGYAQNDGGSDHFYLKIDADGVPIWQTYQQINGSAFRPHRAVRTPDGGFVFMGTNESTVLDFEVYLEKIDANGNILWHTGHNGQHGIQPGGIALMPDGGFLVNGYSQWEIALGDYGITPTFLRFSPTGVFEWEKDPVLGPFSIAYGYNIIPAPGGGYFSVGEVFTDTLDRFSDVMLLKIDENAEPLWWKNYGAKNTEWASDALVTLPNQILMWGFNQPRPPAADLQGVLVRANLDGELSVGVKAGPTAPSGQITLFPNPASDRFRALCQPAPAGAFRWELRDLSGRACADGTAYMPNFEVDVSRLPSGIYQLSLPGQPFAPQRVAVLR